jgi:hypothetical protein
MVYHIKYPFNEKNMIMKSTLTRIHPFNINNSIIYMDHIVYFDGVVVVVIGIIVLFWYFDKGYCYKVKFVFAVLHKSHHMDDDKR